MTKVLCSVCDGTGMIKDCFCPVCFGKGIVLVATLDIEEESDRA